MSVVPTRIITTWICDPARDRFTDRHRAIFDVCLHSWFRLMPDYEFLILTLGNLRSFGSTPWLEAQIAAGNWIGCSQFARYLALWHYGGIFCDADVEAVRRFDSLLDTHCTVGHLGNGQQFANNAVLAVSPNHPFMRTLLEDVLACDPAHPDYGNHTGPFLLTAKLAEAGWSHRDETATVAVAVPGTGGAGRSPVVVRRSAVFYPYTWNQSYDPAVHVQPDTLAVHHWASAWKSRDQQPTHEWRAPHAEETQRPASPEPPDRHADPGSDDRPGRPPPAPEHPGDGGGRPDQGAPSDE